MHKYITLYILVIWVSFIPNGILNAHTNYFITNNGQWSNAVYYKSSYNEGDVYINTSGIRYVLYHSEDITMMHDEESISRNNIIRGHAVQLQFENAKIENTFECYEKLATYYNYYVGDKSTWKSNVALYHKLLYKNLYTGIDWELGFSNENLKYNFIIHPGTSPNKIGIRYEGSDAISINNGNLLINTSVGQIIEQIPKAYQIIDGVEYVIPCNYIVQNGIVKFNLGKYNVHYDIIIDPLVMGTFSGARTQTIANCSSFDTANNMYSCGTSINGIYPVTIGAFRTTYSGMGDVVISKYGASGTTHIFSTYLGGYLRDNASVIKIDATNRIVVCGTTFSPDFPVISGCLDLLFDGDTINRDSYISILNNTGTTLNFSTFIGGSADDEILGMEVNDTGSILLCGATTSFNFPTTPGVYDETYNGNYDAFFTIINPALQHIIRSTFLGNIREDKALGLHADKTGMYYVCGISYSTSFPTTPGAVSRFYRGNGDGFIVRFNNSLNLLASTFVGNTAIDYAKFAILDSNKLYVCGYIENRYAPTPLCKSSSGFGGVFLSCYTPNLDSMYYRVPLSNFDAATQITDFTLSDSNYFLISMFLNRIRSTFPDSVYTTDASVRSRMNSLYYVCIDKNAEKIHDARLINTAQGGHIHGYQCKFNPRNNRLFHVICNRNGETTTTGTPYSTPTTMGEYDMYSMIYQPTISITNSYNLHLSIIDSLYCSRGFVRLENNSTGINSFKWVLPDGSIDSTNRIINFTNVHPGANYITLYLFRNCYTIDTLKDTFQIPERPLSNPIRISDSINCITNPCIFSSQQIRGNRSIWYIPFIGIDSIHDTINTYTTTSGLYTFLLVSDSIECPFIKDTSYLQFFIVDTPSISLSISSDSICFPYQDTVYMNGNAISNVIWHDNLGYSDSLSTYYYLNITNSGIRTIYIEAKNPYCVEQAKDSISIFSFPKPIAAFTSSAINACVDDTIQLTEACSNYQSFQWYANHILFDSISHTIYQTRAFMGNVVITLVAASPYCNDIDSVSDWVQFISKPIAHIDTTSFNTCAPDSILLTQLSQNASRHYWEINYTLIDSLSDSIYIRYPISGQYEITLRVQNDTCIHFEDSTHIRINAVSVPQVSIIADSTICKLDETNFIANALNKDTIYWIVDDTIIIAASDTLYYTFTNSGSHKVRCIVYNVFCPNKPDSASSTCYVNELPQANAFIPDMEFCIGDTVLAFNTSTHNNILFWYYNNILQHSDSSIQIIASTPGINNLALVAYNVSCNAYDTSVWSLLIHDKPNAVIFTYDSILCIPDTSWVRNQSSNYNRYQWYYNGYDSTHLQIPISETTENVYNIQLIVFGDACPHLSDTAIKAIRFNNLPDIKLFINDTLGCIPFNTIAYLNTIGTINRWQINNNSSILVDKDSVLLHFIESGTHQIKVNVVPLQCPSNIISLSKNVQVLPTVQSNFTYTPTFIHTDSIFTLLNTSIGADSSYWKIGNNVIPSISDSMYYLIQQAGTYPICIVGMNDAGCNDSFCQNIIVVAKPSPTPPCLINAVSAFSPNNDGRNDRFFYQANEIENIELFIVNRWGEEVFKQSYKNSSHYTDFWDGTFKGRPAPQGVYSYVIKGVCSSTKEIVTIFGNVTLLR